jgi:hypothetical protein
MAAPQRRYRASGGTRPTVPKGPSGSAARKKAVGHRRGFAATVVVPVLLMLGSVYLHTVSAGLTGEVVGLEEQLARAEAEGERLEVRVAELSAAGRIRALAAEELGMQDPSGTDLEVYRENGEDGTRNGGEEEGGQPR